MTIGSTVARFAGDTVHERLASTDLYKERQYEKALSRTFLATDEDLRASQSHPRPSFFLIAVLTFSTTTDPDFRGDPSGCTAVSIIIDSDYRIICVSPAARAYFPGVVLTKVFIGQRGRFESGHVSQWRGETVIP